MIQFFLPKRETPIRQDAISHLPYKFVLIIVASFPFGRRCVAIVTFLLHSVRSDGHRRGVLLPRSLCSAPALLHLPLGSHLHIHGYTVLAHENVKKCLIYLYMDNNCRRLMTGLLLLLGLVVYVSVFTAEIGSKLRPSSTLQPALFTYTYGYSFHLVVTGFLAGEVI